MAKKATQIRLDKGTREAISEVSEDTGVTISELTRDALRIYLEIYEKKKERGKLKFFIQSRKDKNPCEVLMPWLR
jgi:hypothetical protein